MLGFPLLLQTFCYSTSIGSNSILLYVCASIGTDCILMMLPAIAGNFHIPFSRAPLRQLDQPGSISRRAPRPRMIILKKVVKLNVYHFTRTPFEVRSFFPVVGYPLTSVIIDTLPVSILLAQSRIDPSVCRCLVTCSRPA